MVCQLLVELKEVMKRMPGMRIRLSSVLGPQRFPCEKHESIGEVLSGRGHLPSGSAPMLLSLAMNAVLILRGSR